MFIMRIDNVCPLLLCSDGRAEDRLCFAGPFFMNSSTGMNGFGDFLFSGAFFVSLITTSNSLTTFLFVVDDDDGSDAAACFFSCETFGFSKTDSPISPKSLDLAVCLPVNFY